MDEADLHAANLFKADLTRANFFGADLSDANLLLATVADIKLDEADLTGTRWPKGFDPPIVERGGVSSWRPGGYGLLDAAASHAAHPDTFEIPDEALRQGLVPGLLVKLLFVLRVWGSDDSSEPLFERMWVFVTEVSPDGYTGLLSNQPVAYGTELQRGSTIHFRPENIADIDVPEEGYLPPDQPEFPPKGLTRIKERVLGR